MASCSFQSVPVLFGSEVQRPHHGRAYAVGEAINDPDLRRARLQRGTAIGAGEIRR